MMTKFIRKIFWIFLLSLSASFVFAAATPDTFFVEVSPSSFSAWESVDMTVTAMKDGEQLKEYEWFVFLAIKELPYDYSDYEMPSDSMYEFVASDQWAKLFSKWLKINKAWTYTIVVESLDDSSIRGETTVIVWNSATTKDLEEILISYPIANSIESKNALNVMWSCVNLKNSPVEVYLNNALAGDWYTDSRWNYNIYIPWLVSGENTIQVKIVDISNIVLWESDTITVTYTPPADWIFNAIEVLPKWDYKQWDKITVNVSTTESVSSVELILSNWDTYPMDRISAWSFSKELTLQDAGSIDLSVSLSINGTEKIYQNISNIFVQENIWVSNVKFVSTWVDGTSVIMSWEAIWNAPQYKILYGTQKDSMQKSINVSSTWVLIENLQVNTTYYFQITPMDNSLHASWDPSEIFEFNPEKMYHTCVIKWISVKSEKIWDKYYLVRSPVDYATSYQIYRSDWEDMSSMNLVWETTWTRFEYYFDKTSESDQYAYYQVQAICEDGSVAIIDDAQKVKVWPFENMMLILIITAFIYCIYRLYRTIQ